jgi:hypothetical protein
MRRVLHVALPLIAAVVGIWLSFMTAFIWPEYARNTGCTGAVVTCPVMLARVSTWEALIAIFVICLLVTAIVTLFFWMITHEGAF